MSCFGASLKGYIRILTIVFTKKWKLCACFAERYDFQILKAAAA